MLKKMLLLPFFAIAVLPLSVQAEEALQADSVYTFHFVNGKEAFYVPYRENVPTLARLLQRMESCRNELDNGCCYIGITGYIPASSAPGGASVWTGYLRNNYVKSVLITRCKLTERMFVTDRVIRGTSPDGLSDVVTVTFPAPVEKVEKIVGKDAAEKVKAYLRGTDAVNPERKPEMKPETKPETKPEAQPEPKLEPVEEPAAKTASPTPPKKENAWSLRANLLRWATLTPDLGLEWRIDRHWSVQLNGTWTSWSWNRKDRRYALWNVSPEARYYIGKEYRAYLGAMYHTGSFNYKLGAAGKVGDYRGGGITGGYLLRLNRALSLDFHAAAGYTRADFDSYRVTDGVRVRAANQTKNYRGINQIGVTLAWRLD